MACCFGGGDTKKADYAYRVAETAAEAPSKPSDIRGPECLALDDAHANGPIEKHLSREQHLSKEHHVSSGSGGIRGTSRVDLSSGENAASGGFSQGQANNINEILRLNLGEVENPPMP